MIKSIAKVVSGLAVAGVVMVLLGYYHPWSPLFPTQEPHHIVQRLEILGDSALRARDVPASAIILLGDKIIGTGFTTVTRETNAGGHAEINAISSALRRVGSERFAQIDRDSLILVTTYEPCAMCRGAIINYDIRHVEILKTRRPIDLMREDFRIFRYYWQRRESGPEALQDSLFNKQQRYHGG